MGIKSKVNNFPDSPGVYVMKNAKGMVIYVGKATSLKERVRSYFSSNLPVKTVRQMENVCDIEYEQTETALEALLLESKLIKKFNPKYNIVQKDDKSRAYAYFTKEEFPRISVLRETDLPQIKEKNPLLYGPFLSAAAPHQALDLIRKIIPYRSCRVMPHKKCLYGYLRLCDMPCEKKISKNDYGERIRQVRDFFEGKKSRVISALNREMKQASKNQEFEKAAQVRNRLFALEHLKQTFVIQDDSRGTIYKRIEGYDISNVSGVYATGSMVVFLDGESEKSEYRKFKIKSVAGANDVAMMREVFTRRFKKNKDGSWALPDLILIDGGRGQVSAAVAVLKENHLDIPVVGLAKGPDRKRDELITSRTLPRQDIKILKQVRDEAHSFAKGYYVKLHRKQLVG